MSNKLLKISLLSFVALSVASCFEKKEEAAAPAPTEQAAPQVAPGAPADAGAAAAAAPQTPPATEGAPAAGATATAPATGAAPTTTK